MVSKNKHTDIKQTESGISKVECYGARYFVILLEFIKDSTRRPFPI